MMPAFALIGIPGPRWVPPIPLPLFLLWPLVLIGLGLVKLMVKVRPDESEKLKAIMMVFRETRGLAIDIETADHKPVRIRFV